MVEGPFSEFRRSKVAERWCIIAPGRFTRPTDVSKQGEKRCPFCPGNEEDTPKPTILQWVKDGQWILRVVPNKFPAVSIEAIREGRTLRPEKLGVLRNLPGFGAHEVIIDTPRHGEVFADFSTEQANNLFWAFRERILDLRKDKRLQYILIFRNEGEAAGASLEHSHCQLIALPIVPPLIDNEFKIADKYFDDEGTCVYCDLIKQECAAKNQIFFENEYAVAFSPYDSRSPFEVWVLPKEHLPRYEESRPSYIRGVAEAMNQAVKRLSRALGRPAYNFYLHNGPLRDAETESHFHHHFEIVPRISKLGGFEWGTGLYINIASPEEAAKILREAL